MRLHSISLFDRKGDVLWLSEGALGPDENGFVLEALEGMGKEMAAHRQADFGDGRGAMFLAVRSPQSELVGIVMILVDSKALTGNLASRVLTPPVRSLLQRVAILLRPPGTEPSASHAPAPAAAPAPTPPPPVPAAAEAPKAAPAPAAPPARAAARAAPPRSERRTAPAAPSGTTRAPPQRASAPARPSAPAAAPAAVALAKPIVEQVPQAPETLEWSVPESRQKTGSPSAEITLEVLVPRQVDQILSFELTADLPSAADAIAAGERDAAASGRRPTSAPRETSENPPREAPASAPREAPASPTPPEARATPPQKPAVPASPPVYVQELTKLRTGGRTRRFRAELHVIESAAEREASTTQRHEPQAHALVLKQLIDWLRAHPERRDQDPLSIAIGLPVQALQNERLPALLTGTLEPAALAPDTLGFEIPEGACLTHKPAVERLLAVCEKLGCFVALDDFSLDSGALEFLRSKAVRVVRVDSRLTGTAMRDKLAQARVIAISQATKVLGIHCAAKGVESETTRRWLTAIGFDFAEGRLFEGPKPLDSVLSGQ
jgi:EAL domain-containing protein (putative c-di-GMP-specific phosphodiesterase class I)